MTKELKDKILDWRDGVNLGAETFIDDFHFNELLAIIDEGIEKVTDKAFKEGISTAIEWMETTLWELKQTKKN